MKSRRPTPFTARRFRRGSREVNLSDEFKPLLDSVLSDLPEDFEAGIAAEAVAVHLGAHFERRSTQTLVYDRPKWATACAHVHDQYRPGEHLSIRGIVWR